MYELIQTGEKSWYIDCPAKIGVYQPDASRVYLIDSGNDKDAGRKVRQILEKQGWKLLGILNTHSNADHIGGNRYLQSQTGCRIFAGGIEAAFTEHPILEPSFLYGGYPFKELRHKFLMAKESCVTDFSHESFPGEFEPISLPGHFFDMTGFRGPDGVLFLADCVSSKETLEKYAISFIYDVEAYLNTLDMVERLEGEIFVPAHAEVTKDMTELTACNRDKVYEIAQKLRVICREPMSFEGILQQIFCQYGLAMNFEQHVLVGSTIRSYLSWMKDKGELGAFFEDNMFLWQTL